MQRPFGTNTVRGRFSIHQVQIHEPNRGIGHNLWHMKQAVSCNGTQIPQWDTEQEGAFDTCEGAPLLVPVAAVCKYLWIPEREIPTWKTSGLLRHILIEPLGHETDSKSGKFYSTSQEPANPNKFQHALEFTAWYGPRALSYNYFQNMITMIVKFQKRKTSSCHHLCPPPRVLQNGISTSSSILSLLLHENDGGTFLGFAHLRNILLHTYSSWQPELDFPKNSLQKLFNPQNIAFVPFHGKNIWGSLTPVWFSVCFQ